MDTNEITDLRQFMVKADGGTMKCQPARLTWLKEEFKHLTMHAGWSVNDRRLLAEETRYCRWPGQSTDGKKHADANQGKPAFPFEGASDVRMRTADDIVNEHVILIMAAVMRMQLRFTSPDPAKSRLADQLAVLWEWIKSNQLRREWFVELRKLAQFRQAESPAVGILQVYWREEVKLQNLEVTPDQIFQVMQEEAQEAGVAWNESLQKQIEQMLADSQQVNSLAALLQSHWSELPDGRARKVAKDLQTDQQAVFPYPVPVAARPCIKARRLMEDVFIPENTEEFQRGRVIYVREWFTATELREKERKGEFLPGFVDEVLKHEGESAWRHYTHWHVNGDWSNRIIERTWDKERHRGQYEILCAYFIASNADGVPGVYYVKYHHAVEQPGSNLELSDDKHGLYPFVEFSREILTGRLWDTRGVSELAVTDQNSQKLLHDSFMDHAQLSTVPPLEVPASRPKMQLVIGPLKQIKMNRPGEIKFMEMPQYPQSNEAVQNRIEKRLDRYFGRASESTPKDLQRAYQQDLIDTFLIDLVEVVRMILQLAQQYMDDATVQRVLGPDGLPIAQSVTEIQGQFDVEVSFEAGMLNLEFVKSMAEMINDYARPWDTQNQIRSDELENWFFSSLSPTLARRLLTPVTKANQSEVEAAQKDFGKIKDGIEPERPTHGVDFQTRLNTIVGIGQANPEAFATLTPVSRQILTDHVQYLQGQVQQQQNAVIGREMAQRTLPVEPNQ